MSEFEPQVFSQALTTKIIVVAETREDGTWKACIGPRDPLRPKYEMPLILGLGTAVYEPIARVLFPHFKKLPYAR